MSRTRFEAWEPLLTGQAARGCRAVVIIPARDEAETLGASLDALAVQQREGAALPPHSFEVLLLLNNCRDGSAEVARRWSSDHPELRLHVVERELAPEQAHVGTARRLLMDTAWSRLRGKQEGAAILSTDADTLPAPDWIWRNLAALEAGADAVGGVIALREGELEAMQAQTRRAYLRDRRYQALVAKLEDLLDPQPGDPWPRHLEHFGASLACTPAAYERAGGLPPVKPLEDVAFVNALRCSGARLRHDPQVKVYTSARLHGRVEVGLSGQLKIWQQMSGAGQQHRVLTAGWLAHRFRTLRRLRETAAGGRPPRRVPLEWTQRIAAACAAGLTEPDFLARVDCDALIAATFRGEREGQVARVNRQLSAAIRRAKTFPEQKPS